MAQKTVVVLGGGTGGLVAARRLRRRLHSSDRVVVVERTPVQHFAPSLLWVMSGARRPQQIASDLRRQRRRGIEVLEADVLTIDTASRTVKTTEGAVDFDRLVVALGAELVPAALPGFAELAHNVYTLEGAVAAGRALHEIREGQIAVLVSRLPYKCPAAPYEAAMLADALLRKRGVRDGVSIDVYTPEPFPMPTAGPQMGEALKSLLAERSIGFHPEQTTEQIGPGQRVLVLASGERVSFDVLLGVPPHQAPAVVRESGLGSDTGFIRVDQSTLQSNADGVFAIGDVTAIPIGSGKFLPKAGVFAHAEAEVVAERIADELAPKTPQATFDGKGACFVELGSGVAAYATGNFYADGGPAIDLRHPGRRWHLAKVAFEQYWLRRWA